MAEQGVEVVSGGSRRSAWRGARLMGAALVIAMGASLPAAEPVTASVKTTYSYGVVTAIVDGDTIYVDIAGDGHGSLPVRNAGIQATELAGPGGRSECHSNQATAYMARLVPPGTRVRLAAYYAGSTSGFDYRGVPRLLRYVDRYNPATGRYDIDVQRALLIAGMAMWKPEPVESARNAPYLLPMQYAMAHRRGLFATFACRLGPAQGTPMPMWIHYDADGDDSRMNGEWVRIQNRAAYDMPLAGWSIRGSSHILYLGSTYFRFPAGAVLRAHRTITIYPGSGANNNAAGRYYLDAAPTGRYMPNVIDPRLGYPGKAFYLLDPDLDFRGWASYPCQIYCARPPVHISRVHHTGPREYVDLRVNAGVGHPVDLTDLEVTNDGWTLAIRAGTVLRPGERLRVYAQGPGRNTRLRQFWRHSGYILNDAGDTVVLRTAQSTVISVNSWGTG